MGGHPSRFPLLKSFTMSFPSSFPSRGVQRESLGTSPSSCFPRLLQPLQEPSRRPRWQLRSSDCIRRLCLHPLGCCSAGLIFRRSRLLPPVGRSPVPALRCESLTLQG